MRATLSELTICGGDITLHDDVLSAAYMENSTVQLYTNGCTVVIKDCNMQEAKDIFNHFGIKWHYDT